MSDCCFAGNELEQRTQPRYWILKVLQKRYPNQYSILGETTKQSQSWHLTIDKALDVH